VLFLVRETKQIVKKNLYFSRSLELKIGFHDNNNINFIILVVSSQDARQQTSSQESMDLERLEKTNRRQQDTLSIYHKDLNFYFMAQPGRPLNMGYSWPGVFLLGASGRTGRFFTQLLFHNPCSGYSSWLFISNYLA